MLKSSFLERFTRFLSPSWFFTGLALGMALLILAGNWASTQNTYSKHSRFFQKLGPDGNVYPTLNNLLEFVRHRAPKDKTLVLVGGSSKFLGIGQKNDQLWSKLLQERLGSDFSVVNISFRGCSFISVGLPVAMILSQEYPNFYFVCDAPLFEPMKWFAFLEGRSYPYNYMLWQARLDNQWKSIPSLEAEAMNAVFNKNPAINVFAQEDMLRAYFEKLTRSSDLWNYVGYHHFFPVYSYLLNPDVPFWTPRSDIIDDETDPLPSPERHHKYIERNKGFQINPYILLGIELTPSSAETVSKRTLYNLDSLDQLILDDRLKNRFLPCLVAVNSFYLDYIKQEEKELYLKLHFENIAAYKGRGYTSISLGEDYPPEDYLDPMHFSNSAAPKMAEEVASALLGMDRRNRTLGSAPNE